jgi:hypothetical protein
MHKADRIELGLKAMKKNSVLNVAFRHTADYVAGEPISGAKLDNLVNTCVSRATTALERDAPGYTRNQKFHISDVFNSLLSTHRTIRRLLKDLTPDDPESVDALSLLRLQFEGLFTICLMLEGASYVDAYLQDYWRKRYVQYLLVREECSGLSNHQEYLTNALPGLVNLRNHFGISADQQATVDLEELGTPLPPSLKAQKLAHFPTPGKVPDKITVPDKRRMLERLNVEYGYLCSFSHVLAEANLLKGIFNKRSKHRDDAQVSESDLRDKFEMLVISAANLKSCLCVAQATTELTLLYPNDLDLSAIAITTWNTICEANLLARIVWALRARSVLGVIT